MRIRITEIVRGFERDFCPAVSSILGLRESSFGDFLGGVTEGGGDSTPTLVRGTMFLGSGAVTPGLSLNSTSPSLLREDQTLRNNCVTAL